MVNDGYIGEAPARVKCPGTGVDSSNDRGVQGVVRSRHETLNGRFKFWEILKQPFWHNMGRFIGPLRLSYNLVLMRVTNYFQ